MLRKPKDTNEPIRESTIPNVPPPPISRPAASRDASAPKPAQQQSTVVGENMRFKGDITGKEELTIAGNFVGTINLPDNKVVIRQPGTVEAKISAKNIVVEGRVTGDFVASDTMHVLSSGIVHGDVKTRSIVLENECDFNGSIQMIKDAPAEKKPAEQKAAPPKPQAKQGSAAAKKN